jgi:hypothetical protein
MTMGSLGRLWGRGGKSLEVTAGLSDIKTLQSILRKFNKITQHIRTQEPSNTHGLWPIRKFGTNAEHRPVMTQLNDHLAIR